MDIDVQDSGSAPPTPMPDDSSRRRLLGACVLGLAGSLVPQLASRASASTGSTPDSAADGSTDTAIDAAPDTANDAEGGPTPASTAAVPSTSAPPRRPTDADGPLLGFAQELELAAVGLYDTALASGSITDSRTLLITIREAHLAYAQALSALLGKSAPGTPLASGLESFAGFGGATADVLAAAYDLEAAALATHTELIGELQGIDGAALLASILIAEARHCTVLADLAGATDLDVLLLSDASVLVGG